MRLGFRHMRVSLALWLVASSAFGQDGAGFSITRGDQIIAGDRQVFGSLTTIDKALQQADIRVQVDGLEIRQRLDVVVSAIAVQNETDRLVTAQSRLNYPGFVARGEFRVFGFRESGRAKLISVHSVDPNGSASFVVPNESKVAIVHRVYDATGRFDETVPVEVGAANHAEVAGRDATARRGIHVRGGAVTVSGSGLAPGGRVQALGETVWADSSGRFVVQRILPPGPHSVQVQANGFGQAAVNIVRPIEVKATEFFGVGLVDLTVGQKTNNGTSQTYANGRMAGYAKGHTAAGWTLSAAIDTGEEPVTDLFDGLLRKDAQGLLLRMAREDGYLTYGDDSTIEDAAPTRGKLFARVEKDGNHLTWGTMETSVSGGQFLRNERELYGLHGSYRGAGVTAAGEARVAVNGYIAQPETLPAREVLRGTGGSVYFLQKQAIEPGSEQVTLERRDPISDRVIDRQILVRGRDYDLNPLQGVIVLDRPISGGTDDTQVNLVVQYEYAPTGADIDGLSYGGRAEFWVTNRLLVGATGLVEQTGIADQKAGAVDLRWKLGENSIVELEYATSEGPGFGSSLSSDGGLIVTSTPTTGTSNGRGSVLRASGQLELSDFGGPEGDLDLYYETRKAGFSSLDYEVAEDSDLWGASLGLQVTENVTLNLSYDDFKDASGKAASELGAEIGVGLGTGARLSFGADYIDLVTPGDAGSTGSRLDASARFDVERSKDLRWYVFGQYTLSRTGGLPDDNRVGLGVERGLSDGWSLAAEASVGTSGPAGALTVSNQKAAGDRTYLGYRLDPAREIAGVTLAGQDRGQFVAGATRTLDGGWSVFGENTYDLFGTHQSLVSAYGVEYQSATAMRYSAALETGRVRDPAGDFDRDALSLGFSYANDALSARGRLEYRRDRGVLAGSNRDSDTLLLTGAANWQVDDARRVTVNLDYADIDTDNSAILSGDYARLKLGYAARPVLDDRFNLLFGYTYLDDMVGQRVDGSETSGPVQESHVLSADVLYDASPRWTLGAKFGARLSNSAPDDTVPLQQNDAWLTVLNARYHVTHKWNVLLEGRRLVAEQAGFDDTSALASISRQIGRNIELGAGYNFGAFSDDLTDLTYDDKGAFINLVAKF